MTKNEEKAKQITNYVVDAFRNWEQTHNRENYGRYDAFAAGYNLARREERVRALDEVLTCLDREDSYLNYLDEEHQARDARYAISVIRSYVKALKK